MVLFFGLVFSVPPLPPSGRKFFCLRPSCESLISASAGFRFNWEKIPDFQVTNAENIWAGSQNQIKVDFQTIEDLFTVNDRPLKRSAHRGSIIPNAAIDSDSSNTDDMKGKVGI